MTSNDLPAFTATVKRLAVVFRLRMEPAEFSAMTLAYFNALTYHNITDIERGADAWIAAEQKFPKPIEWKRAIPRRAAELRSMTSAEAREYLRAELAHWEDEPCQCADCITAGVNEKPIRFVPEFDDVDCDVKVMDPIKNRCVTAGHWAHGYELSRWYEARANFYEKALSLGILGEKAKREKLPFEKRIEAIYEKKRPKKSDFVPVADIKL